MESLDHRVSKPIILVVDDTPVHLQRMYDILKVDYKVKVATSGARAILAAHDDPQPDVILLDVLMPQMDGYEVCRKLKQSEQTQNIPIIFLTSKSDSLDEQSGLDVGAMDYIVKPASPAVTLARIKNQIRQKKVTDLLADRNRHLRNEVRKGNEEIWTYVEQLRDAQDVTILALSTLAEKRDNETGNHIQRTRRYVLKLAEHLANHHRFSGYLTVDVIDMLFKSAPLHDIGKVGIPDRILLKPGKLTVDEFEVMKTHPAIGKQAIEVAEKRLGRDVPYLRIAKEIAYSHHEKWDGSGYPEGLSGDDIPVSARLMAIADVYDALMSTRPYKSAFSHDDAVMKIVEGKGTHFDPDVVVAFQDISEEFKFIAEEFADEASVSVGLKPEVQLVD